jgi:hypothetical protein
MLALAHFIRERVKDGQLVLIQRNYSATIQNLLKSTSLTKDR